MSRPADPGNFVQRLAWTLAVALTCLVALSGCSDIQDQMSGPQSYEPLGSEAAQAVSPPAGTDNTRTVAALETGSWGTVDGLLSVVVSNRSRHTLSHAVATLTALDANGQMLGTHSAPAPDGRCCTVADLPPGGTYGFYFDVGQDVAAVAAVELTYRDISWARSEPTTTTPMRATPVGVEAGAQGAVVVADVATPGPAVTDAVVQAYLVDAEGAFLAVVSGRWTCFAAGGTRRIEMQLFHPVPDGAAVRSMVAYPSIDARQSTSSSCPA